MKEKIEARIKKLEEDLRNAATAKAQLENGMRAAQVRAMEAGMTMRALSASIAELRALTAVAEAPAADSSSSEP